MIIFRNYMDLFKIILFIFTLIRYIRTNSCYIRGTEISRRCQPHLLNIAQYAKVRATSTCGNDDLRKSDEFCMKWYNSSNVKTMKCFDCSNFNNSINNYNASKLIDHHVKGHETFWLSNEVPNFSPKNIVNITLDLKHLFEVLYITLELCGDAPDGIAFYRSSDYGVTYQPWDYFARSCKQLFQMKKVSRLRLRYRRSATFHPYCFPLNRHLTRSSANFKLLPFNPMYGRNDIMNDYEGVEKWITLTNLKISLIRKKSIGRKRRRRRNNVNSDKFGRFCVSDITVGGRSQCYGHAEGVMKLKRDGSLQCKCMHNTSGRNCEKCKETHGDYMWNPIWLDTKRGIQCKQCFCNNHSKKCVFNSTVFVNSNRKHGSQCISCQHNTAGDQCEKCAPGFYRNPALPITHAHVCQSCKCHTIGAQKPVCNQETGQCICKPGVEGRSCNRCKKGYHQTNLLGEPCKSDIQTEMMSTQERCNSCGKRKLRIKFRKYCRKHIMIKMSIQSKEHHNEYTRFGVKILRVWRVDKSIQNRIPDLRQPSYSIYSIWVPNSDLRCRCPYFELGHTYLVLSRVRTRIYNMHHELVLNRKSTVLDWRDNWNHRLDKFKQRESEGKCTRFDNDKKDSRRQRRRRRRRQKSFTKYQNSST